MKDNCQREITYLRLSVTDLCNLRCRYCMPAEGVAKKQHSEICSVEELVEMAAAAAGCGVTKVRLTGGEPLVRREIVDICRGVAALPGVREVDMTTNGILLPELARPLREAGLHRLNVSLDTLRPDRYAHMTRLGRLEDALAGLRAAVDAGFTGTKLNVVLMAGCNDDEIEDFVALTAEYPLEVRFIELMPMAQADAGVYLPGDTVLERCRSLVPAEPSGVARRWRLPGGKGLVGLIEPMSRRFCDSCDRIRITADGRLKPCLHSSQEIILRGLHGEELRQAVREGIAAKPERHHMAEEGRSQTERNMNEIGG